MRKPIPLTRDYEQRLRFIRQSTLERFLDRLRMIIPEGSVVVSKGKDDSCLHLYRAGAKTLAEALPIPLDLVEEYIGFLEGITRTPTLSPLTPVVLETSQNSVRFYASQIPSLIMRMRDVRDYRGNLPYYTRFVAFS